MPPHTQTLSVFCKVSRLFWLHCTPSEGGGWKQTAQINTLPPSLVFFVPWPGVTHPEKSIQRLTHFEGKFRNTYLFWADLLFEGASFFWKYTKWCAWSKLWSSPWNLLLSVHPCCARDQKSQPILGGKYEFSKSSLDVLTSQCIIRSVFFVSSLDLHVQLLWNRVWRERTP